MKNGAFGRGLALGFAFLALAACSQAERGSAPAESAAWGNSPRSPETDGTTPLPTSSASLGAEVSPTAEPSFRKGREVRQIWEDYPWGPDDGLACPAPGYSPGTGRDPAGPGVVVLVGDSLIRESRAAIAESLAEAGFDVVFICWGGKNLEWGLEQVAELRALDLMPACLVFNLGTNDLKGTTAQGLADAVPMATVSERLTTLLIEVADVPDVFVVDLAADLSLAPDTMVEVGDAPGVWQAAVAHSGIGAAIPWSDAASERGIIGADGVHDSLNGQYARAGIITEYVERDCTA